MITEATIEADPAKNCDFKIGRRFGKWRVTNKLDEGGFGQVYRVENIYKKGEFAALKAEPNDIEGGSAIKLEIMILQFLNKGGDKPHVMKVYHAAKHRRFCYMIVTLLGENLRTLKLNCPDERMSISTWSRIGIQCLYSIKLLHDVGFVHRDIKPANFVMGDEHDADRARCVHILDFGLARNFAFERKKGVWAARRARGSAEFRGTMRYCSPTVHDKKEQGRKDDVWSLMYMLIELHCGLPWQKEKDKKRLEMMKMNMSDKDLLKNFPAEMHPVLPHLRTLNCYSRPNYTMIHKCFLRLMKRLDIKYNDKYDWETDAQVEELIKRRTKVPEYEHSEEFFASDPIKVHGAPPKWLDTKGGRTMEDLEEMMSKPMEVDRTRSSSKNSRRKTATKK
uniref:non-specific serine/threonine protein kinase n=1 Tax=Ascaris suum TaxID=6253 RepID=F1L6L3_ASCSU